MDNDWTQTHRIKSRVIAKYDQFVHIEVGDLNGDQRPELIVTVAAISGRPGKLWRHNFSKISKLYCDFLVSATS